MRIEPHHVGLARAISEVARQHGAVADRGAVHEVQIAVAARPDDLDVGFWRAVLGYSTLADDNGVDPLGHGSTFWMRDLDPAKPLRHAMHVGVFVAREYAEERLEAALAAGGRIVDESEARRFDPLRPCRQPRLHRRLAGRSHGRSVSGRDASDLRWERPVHHEARTPSRRRSCG